MADNLDVMSIGIENESTIIVGMVVRSDTGWSVIQAASRKRCFIELVHGRSVLSCEGDMNASLRHVSMTYPEKRLWFDPVACDSLALGVEAFDAKREKGEIVEVS